MEIRIALTNLGKYNEGELTYAWLSLPATDEEIAESLKEINIAPSTEINVAPSTEYDEHFISEYEAPFSIGEYESITKLNEVAKQLVDVETPEKHGLASYKYYDAGEVITFADSLENANLVTSAMAYVGDIVDDEQLDEMVDQITVDGGWQRVKFFLSGIDSINDDYYHIDGYANAQTLRPGILDSIVADLMDEMKRIIGE